MCNHGHHFKGIRAIDDIKARCFVTEGGCWRWLGAITKNVPMCYFNPFKRSSTVGQAIHYLQTGRRLSGNLMFRFHCGTEWCVNPEHGGPQTRSAALKGSRKNPKLQVANMTRAARRRSKLTESDIEAIKASPESTTKIAAIYGISQSHASRIRMGRSWFPIASAASVFNLGAQP